MAATGCLSGWVRKDPGARRLVHDGRLERGPRSRDTLTRGFVIFDIAPQ